MLLKSQKTLRLFSILKIIIVVLFTLIGFTLTITGSIILSNQSYYEISSSNKWIFIIQVTFGIFLAFSPILVFEDFNKPIEILKMFIVVLFLIFGLFLIILNSISLAQKWYDQVIWSVYLYLIFGIILVITTPFYLINLKVIKHKSTNIPSTPTSQQIKEDIPTADDDKFIL